MSLRYRLNGLLAVTITLLVVGGMILVIFKARESVRNEIESTVRLAARLIRAQIDDEPFAAGFAPERLRELQDLGPIRHLRIAILPLDRDGSRYPQAVVRVSAPGVPNWFVRAVAPETLRFSRAISFGNGGNLRVLIQADPADEIAEAWNEALDFFALIAGMAALVFIVVTITVERAFKPVGVILEGLDRLENGQYQLALPDFPLAEFSRIAQAINQTAAALDAARRDNRALRQHSLEVREQERRYLARELHDEFGQSLSAIKVVAASLKSHGPDQGSRSALESIQATCDHLFKVLGTLLRQLHPLILDELGLKAALEDLLESWSLSQPALHLNYDLDPAIDGFPQHLQIHVFRIVQEGVTNIVKHAAATRAGVHVAVEFSDDSVVPSRLLIEVSDNGRGFDSGAARSGFGLRGIRERVEGLGGETLIHTAPGRGVRIEIAIPFKGTLG
ncbi:MAG: ATP-binding protein [Gammaproteobacteria bacterium]